MRVVFMGTPNFSVPILNELNKHYQVVLVVTQPDKKVGRKQTIQMSPVKEYALNNGLTVFQPTSIKTDYLEVIKLKPDIIVTASYGQMLPKELFAIPKLINVHGSLLPKRRGGAPVQRAIMEGDLKTGITILNMTLKMDAGKMIAKREIPILETDTTTTLMEKLSYLGAELLIEVLPKIFSNEIEEVEQDENEVTFSYNLTKEDEILNFNKPTKLVLKQLNGLLDEPGGSIFLDETRIKIYKMKKSDIISLSPPNTIISVDKTILIKTIDGVLEIEELQEAGKKRMYTKDYLNGQKKFVKGGIINETIIF